MKRLLTVAAYLIATFSIGMVGVVSAADVQWSKGFNINCTDAIEREDGTALPVAEIGAIKYYVYKAGNSVHERIYTFTGTCRSVHIDTKFLTTGPKEIHATTVDTDGRESSDKQYPPAYLVNIIKSNPKNPSGLR